VPFILLTALALSVASAIASPMDDELWILTAGRGAGAGGSFWATDLLLMAPGDEALDVELTFLSTTAHNRDAEPVTVRLEGGAMLLLPDVVRNTFGLENGFGAIHIEVADDEAEDQEQGEDAGDLLDEETELVAHARVYSTSAAGNVGLGLAGVGADAAIAADDGSAALLVGVGNGAESRSNWFGVNLTEVDDEPATATARAELFDDAGDLIASKEYAFAPAGVLLVPVSDLAPAVEEGTLRFSMLEGEALFGASRVDNHTNDAAALQATLQGNRDHREFTDEFAIEDCTFSSTGENAYFPLRPGMKIVLEGDEDGEVISNTIEVLGETYTVDGVETRVVTETERVDGELAEISRNYFAQCEETGSVFYFGEHVDIYEDDEIVSHDGAWLAGAGGARAGIIMPGTILAGSRYFQEVAPGVALDRAEHIATGIDFQTEGGAWEDCLVVEDSSALDPSSRDRKVYCPGVGLVYDAGIELTSGTNFPD
jgi:hypothetical protein